VFQLLLCRCLHPGNIHKESYQITHYTCLSVMQNVKVKVSIATSLSDQELEDVISVSNLAYLDASSPGMNLLSGGKLELLPDLFRAMTRCCLIDGECYIATEVGTQKIVGTACWFPPGKQVWATDEIRQATGFDTFFGKLDQVARDWWINEYKAQVTGFLNENYGPETALESWWLNNVAVLPEYQGNGIATSLLDEVLKKVTTNEAIGCCTDSEKNVKFYKSLRFKEIGILHMRHPADGSDVKIWGLKQYRSTT